MLVVNQLSAQTDSLNQPADSVSAWDDGYTYTGKHKKWKFLLGFDARRSFFAGKPVKIGGLRIGMEYKGIHRFGFGLYQLKKNVIFTDVPVDRPDGADTSRLKFALEFGTLFYERVVYGNKKWEISVPISLGRGDIKGSYLDTAGIFQPLVLREFSMLAFGISARYKLFSWLALGTGLGYRLLYKTEPEVRKTFQGVYYKYGVYVLFGELYRTVFKKN